MSKYGSKRYSQMMQSIASLVSDGNNLFGSVMQGSEYSGNELTTFDIVPSQLSLDDLIYSFQAHITVLGNLKEGEEVDGQQYEDALKDICDELKSRFTEYKKNHEEFKGADYRKLEYVSNVIDTYIAENAQLTAHSGYDLSDELSVMDDAVNKYGESQKGLDDAIAEFDEYLNDPDLDLFFIPEHVLNEFEDHGLTGESILKYGSDNLIDVLNDELRVTRDDIQREKANHREALETYEKAARQEIEAAEKDYAEKTWALKDAHEKKIEELTNQQKASQKEFNNEENLKIRDEYYAAVAELGEFGQQELSKDIAYGGYQLKDGVDAMQWKEEIRGKSSEELTERSEWIDKIIVNNDADVAEAQDRIKTYDASIAQVEALIKDIDKELENVEAGEEFKKVEAEYQAGKNKENEIERLINLVSNNKLEKISKEEFANVGIEFAGQTRAAREENLAIEEALNSFNKGVQNFLGIGSTVADHVAGDLKQISLLYNATNENGIIVQGDQYAEEHDGKLPLAESYVENKLGEFVDYLTESASDLQDFKGKLTTKEEGFAIRRLIDHKDDFKEFADAISDDAPKSYQAMKKACLDLEANLSAIQKNRTAKVALNSLGAIVEGGSRAEKLQVEVLGQLRKAQRDVKKENEPTNLRYHYFKKDRTQELLEQKALYESSIQKQKDKKAELESNIKQRAVDKDYLKKVKKVISAVDKLNAAERETGNQRKEYEGTRDEILKTEVQYRKDQDKLSAELQAKKDEISKKHLDAVKLRDLNKDKAVRRNEEKISGILEFGKKINKLEKKSDELVEGAKNCLAAEKNVKDKALTKIDKVADEKADIINDLNALEDTAFDKLARSPKVGVNSSYFNEVMTAIKEYKVARNQADGKTLTEEQQHSLTENLRQKLNAYISARETGAPKATRGGQMRLDGMKHILSILDQKEENLRTFASEVDDLEKQAQSVKQPKIKSEIEKEILTKAKNQIAKNVEGPIRKMPEKKQVDIEKLRSYFKCITENVAKKDEYLAKLAELPDRALLGKDNRSFTWAVAATFVANKLSEKGLEKQNVTVKDGLFDFYMQTPKVKEMSRQLSSGKLSPEDFVKQAEDPEYIKTVHDQAVNIKKEYDLKKNGPEKEAKEKGMEMHN